MRFGPFVLLLVLSSLFGCGALAGVPHITVLREDTYIQCECLYVCFCEISHCKRPSLSLLSLKADYLRDNLPLSDFGLWADCVVRL